MCLLVDREVSLRNREDVRHIGASVELRGGAGLRACQDKSVRIRLLGTHSPRPHSLILFIMAPTTPPLDFKHKQGEEIPTKQKNAIRELHSFRKIPSAAIQIRYKLRELIIRRILNYDVPKRARPTRTGRPQKLTN